MFSAGCMMKGSKLVNKRARNMIILAILMLLFGAAMPFAMIIQMVESTFFLNFAAFAVSVSGLFLGVLGVASYVGDVRRREVDEWQDEWDQS